MRSGIDIYKLSLFSAIMIPLLSVNVLSYNCALGDIFFNCCENYSAEQHSCFKFGDSHDRTGDDHQDSFMITGGCATTDHDQNRAPDQGKKNCCDDLASGFYSIFQIQKQQYHAENHYRPSNVIQAVFSYQVNWTSITLTLTPIDIRPFDKKPLSGRSVRIQFQSFLN